MPVIDADTHATETEATWSHFEKHQELYRPFRLCDPNEPVDYWLVDGINQPQQRLDESIGVTVASRELDDVDARLRDMDRMGVDIGSGLDSARHVPPVAARLRPTRAPSCGSWSDVVDRARGKSWPQSNRLRDA